MNITAKQSHPRYPFVRIFTFGEFTIERLVSISSVPTCKPCYVRIAWDEWSNRRASMDLLKILLCMPNRRASKDELIESIWPNHAMINALHTLDSAASILRRHILQVHSGESLLQTVRGNGETALKLATQSYLWVDADAFLTLAARADRAEKGGQDPLPLLERAHTFVQGQFLEEDLHAPWSQGRRNTVNGARRRVFYKLVELYLRGQRVCEAEALLFSFLEENPTDEDALCQLMIILAERERRQEALNMYAYVADELRGQRKEPAPYTQELVQRIRRGLAVREASMGYAASSLNWNCLAYVACFTSSVPYENLYTTSLLPIAVGIVCLDS